MIEFVNISKTYNGLVAVKDINLEIDEQEFTFLVGASGSGKTTLIKLLIREEFPTEGSIFFYETDVTKLKDTQVSKLRREIGVVFQDFKLLPHKNLFENIAFALEVSGKSPADIQETVTYVLELVDLADRAEAFPNEISGGEKQKVAIARAVANNPKVLLADEPTGNLDPGSSWEIINLLNKINEWGTTVVMATHGSDIVEKMGKRVVTLEKGEVISDTKDEPAEPVPVTKPESSMKKDKGLKKLKPKKKKAKKAKPKLEEKELEISFTTKQSLKDGKDKKPKMNKKKKKVKEKKNKSSKKKSKPKRKGSDVVDIHKLRLPAELEEKLLLKGIGSLKKLNQINKDKNLKTKGFSTKEVILINKKLKKSK